MGLAEFATLTGGLSQKCGNSSAALRLKGNTIFT
jgi:hypothetical protein